MARLAPANLDPWADTVLHNGKILTVDPRFRIVEALAVKSDRIVALGPDDEILSTAGPTTQRIDLGGRTALPGFIDAHAHMDREGLRHAYPNLQNCGRHPDEGATAAVSSQRALHCFLTISNALRTLKCRIQLLNGVT